MVLKRELLSRKIQKSVSPVRVPLCSPEVNQRLKLSHQQQCKIKMLALAAWLKELDLLISSSHKEADTTSLEVEVASREVLKEEAVAVVEEEIERKVTVMKKINSSQHVKSLILMAVKEEAEVVVEIARNLLRTRLLSLKKLSKKMSMVSRLPLVTAVVVVEATTVSKIVLANKSKKVRTKEKLMKATNRKDLTNKTMERLTSKAKRTAEVVDVVIEIEAEDRTNLLLPLKKQVVLVNQLEEQAVEEANSKPPALRLRMDSKKREWCIGRLLKRLTDLKEMLVKKCKSKPVTLLAPLLCKRIRAINLVRLNPHSATSSLLLEVKTNDLNN